MTRVRYVLAVCSFLLLAVAAFGDLAETNQGVRMALDLSDGSRIIGAPMISTVSLQTSYAKLNIPLNRICNISIHENRETASLELANGDHLQGVMSLGSLELETIFGKVSLRIVNIRSIQIWRGGTAVLTQLREGLVLYYSFDKDEGDKVTDASGKENHGKVKGARWTPEGKVGGAYSFDGLNNYIEVSDSDSLDLTNEMTISVWMKMHSRNSASQANILEKYPWVDGQGGYIVRVEGEPVVFHAINGRDGSAVRSKTAIENDTLYHLAATLNGKQGRLYINGIPDNSVTFARLPIAGNSNLYIGRKGDDPSYSFNGMIDEVMIFNRALSENEVKALYDSQK